MKDGGKYQVCIAGLGPSGLGAALTLLNSELASHVVCIDQGGPLNERACSVLQNRSCEKEIPCQMVSGFGGCSLLSGGKISAFPAGSGLATVLGSKNLANKKLGEAITLLSTYIPLRKPGIPPNEIEGAKELFGRLGFNYKYFDAYQFDQKELRKAYQRIYSELKSAGMSVLLNTTLINVSHEEQGFRLVVGKDGHEFNVLAKYLVLGIGRLGESILKRINTQLNLRSKAGQLDVGVRLEFPTELFPEITRYHNDLKLLFNGARTFCVCKDGKLAPYVIEGVFFTEGYFDSSNRSGLTNLGIITRLGPSNQNKIILEDIKGKALRYRGGKLAYQKLPEYIDNVSGKICASGSVKDCGSFCVWDNVNNCFPPSISTTIREAVLYFADRLLPRSRWKEVNVFSPEVNYTGILFPVKSDFSLFPGLYMIGDCTGQFRGIAQAFCSGIICAEGLIGNSYDKSF